MGMSVRPNRDRWSGYSTIPYGLTAILDQLRLSSALEGVQIDFSEVKADMASSKQRMLIYPNKDGPLEGPDDQDTILPEWQFGGNGNSVVINGDRNNAGAGLMSYAQRYPNRGFQVAHIAADLMPGQDAALLTMNSTADVAQLLVLLRIDDKRECVSIGNKDLADLVNSHPIGGRIRASALGSVGPVGESVIRRIAVSHVRLQGFTVEVYGEDWSVVDSLINATMSTLRRICGAAIILGQWDPLEEYHIQANVGSGMNAYLRVPIYYETPALRIRSSAVTVVPDKARIGSLSRMQRVFRSTLNRLGIID